MTGSRILFLPHQNTDKSEHLDLATQFKAQLQRIYIWKGSLSFEKSLEQQRLSSYKCCRSTVSSNCSGKSFIFHC